MSRIVAGLSLLLLALALPARADSDGYYCVGPGYLAWQTRGFDRTDGAGRHLVHAIRFASTGELLSLSEVVLDDFQPHTFSCDAARIRIGGWDRAPVEFEIAIGDSLRVLEQTRQPEGAAFTPPATPLPNLGNWSTPGDVLLERSANGVETRLVTSRTSESIDGGILHRHRAELRRVSSAGEVLTRLPIFEGEREETVD